MSFRKANSVRTEKRGFWVFGEHRFHFTRSSYFRMSHGEFSSARKAVDASGVAPIGDDGDRTLWWTADGFFWEDEGLGAEEVELLVWDRRRRSDTRIDRLRKLRAREADIETSRRERIPDEVRAFVWERDDGSCVRCGSEDDLQFDHVIPVAKGGGAAAENVQILCGPCNREKSDSIV